MTARVTCEDVGVRFLFDRQRRVVTPALARFRRRGEETWGLRHVSLELGPGEAVALLGASGSGKTSLLRVLAGVFGADEGRVEVVGRIGALLSVESGLSSRLTGAENAALLAVLAGLTRRDARALVPAVRAESQLGAAFDRPVSSYSQGMRARLGYAVAELVRPEVLLLDEVLEALDHEFRDVVEARARAILDDGGIVLAAGHDHELLGRLCTRAVFLEQGTVRAAGAFAEVRDAYLAAAHHAEADGR